ncbi:MAG: hypothetical protein IKA81_04680 [Alistipes sp.]|nr:hypothetical protein [Alistipes sp.]MBR7171639.1 hypothetical protein [Prevotella sp.]
MKIIVIKGNPNSGKTTSIRLVYDLLLYKGAKIDKPRNSGKTYADFDTELLYNGKNIAISSAGDLLKNIHKTVSDHDGCDILITASRNFRRSSLDRIFSDYDVVYIKKEKRGDRENIATAKEVLQHI